MPRLRQHVNPLKSDLLDIADVARVSAAPGQVLEVELGAAEAHFLIERARAHPAGLYVGVDIRNELVIWTNAECARAGVANVRCVFANLLVDMPRLFAPESVRRFFLNFPDPWFKARQHKRRLVAPTLIDEIRGALVPGGELFVQTDIFELALETMASVESASPGFTNVRGAWSFFPDNPYGAKSRRERQCENDGVRIWRLLYEKAQPPIA